MTQQAVPFDVKSVRKGALYLIRKGTEIRTTAKVKSLVAGKDQFIKVDHVFPEHRITASSALHDRYNFHLHTPELVAEWKALEASDPKAFHCNSTIVKRPARVVWVGSGGYWKEAEFHELDLVK